MRKKLAIFGLTVALILGVILFSVGQQPMMLPGYDLDDLIDVNANSPTDAYVLTWSATTSKWIAASASVSPGDIDHDSLLNYVAAQHIDWTSATDNLVTTGSGSFGSGIFGGTDKITISEDETDAWVKWDDGYLKLQTDEGTNTVTYLWVQGKGTKMGSVVVVAPSAAAEVYFQAPSALFAEITTSGSAMNEFRIRAGGGSNEEMILAIHPKGTGDAMLKLFGGGTTYHHFIRGSDAEGLAGADLRIGVDPSLYSVHLMDRADIDADLGIIAKTRPTFHVWDLDLDSRIELGWATDDGPIMYMYSGSNYGYVYYTAGAVLTLLNNNGGIELQSKGTTFGYQLKQNADISSGHLWQLHQSTTAWELTDTDAEQGIFYVGPVEVAQTDTSAWVGILLDVILTSEGDGSAGVSGNCLMDLRVSSVSKFYMDKTGGIFPVGMKSGATQGGAGAAAGELWIDTDDNAVYIGT